MTFHLISLFLLMAVSNMLSNCTQFARQNIIIITLAHRTWQIRMKKEKNVNRYMQICFKLMLNLLYRGGFFSPKNDHVSALWHSWLRHCASSRKVAGSIPDSVIGIFHGQIPSGRTMALGLIQPLTEMCTRNISWGKGGRCVGLTTLPPSCADCHEIWEPQPPETLRACPGL